MRLALLVLLSLLLHACSGGGGAPAAQTPPPATTCPIPVAKASPSFSADIVPALKSSCGSAATSCHGGAAPSGHVSYSGTPAQIHAQWVNVAPANAPAGWVLIKPGAPAQSWVMEKVTKDQPGGGFGTRMPQGAPALCTATVDTLAAWISAGALNN